MQEVVKTRLPLIAWRGGSGQYYLIYDDLRVGELIIDAQGNGTARYHDLRWTIERLDSRRSVLRQEGYDEPLGSLELSDALGLQGQGPEQGEIQLNTRTYPCLRDARKIPPRVTITHDGGRPLLQFHQETAQRGKIQIDDQTAAASPDFEIIVLWGLHLYMTAVPVARNSPPRVRPSIRKSTPPTNGHGTKTPTRRRSAALDDHSATIPPTPPPEDKQTGGNGDGGGSQGDFWLSFAVGLIVTLGLFGLFRGLQRAASKR